MNWDEYNWYFDKNNAPSDTTDGTTDSNPWGSISVTCVGSACCYDGSTYDSEKNMCVPNVMYNQELTETPETTEIKESFTGLDKYGFSQLKSISLNNTVSPLFSSLSKF